MVSIKIDAGKVCELEIVGDRALRSRKESEGFPRENLVWRRR